MQITEKGKQVATSLEFAQQMKTFLAELHAEGVPEKVGTAAGVSLIAWVLTGHDIDRPPQTDDELAALAIFCDSHAKEIEAAGGAIITTLCNVDCGPTIH